MKRSFKRSCIFFFWLYSLCLNCLFPCQRNLFLLTVYLHAWSSLKQIFHLMQIGLWMGLDLCSCYLFMMPSPNYQKVKPACSFVGSWLQYSLDSFLIKAVQINVCKTKLHLVLKRTLIYWDFSVEENMILVLQD